MSRLSQVPVSLAVPFTRVGVACRRLAARRPWTRWVPLVAATTGLVLSVGAHQRRVETARAAWADTVEVWVVEVAGGPGTPVIASRAEVPAAVVPDAAVAASDDVAAMSTVRRVAVGAVLTDLDVTADDPALALVPDGWRGVAVVESTPSGATVGERVDVVSDGVVIAADDTGVRLLRRR